MESTKGSDFVFDYVQLLYYKFHKINPNQGPYIDCADWIKNKKATINPIDKKDNKCFQYTVALNDEEIKKDPQGITNIKPFLNEYKWEWINIPSEKEDWENLGKNNAAITLNVLYAKKDKTYSAYVSKHNPTSEKQVILLMIPSGEKLWQYLAVKSYHHY